MKNRKNDDYVTLDREVDRIGEPAEEGSSNTGANELVFGRARSDSIVGCAELAKELYSQLRRLRFVPIECCFDVAINGPPSENPRRVHRLRVARRSRIPYADVAAPGERS